VPLDEIAARGAIEQIRPLLQNDGGDVEFVALDGGVVKVRLKGTCAGCPFSRMTLKKGIEARLKQQFPDLKAVVEAP
jgi:Fe-S cluster biogenesis protein NfuA